MRAATGFSSGRHQFRFHIDSLDDADNNSWKICVGVGDDKTDPANVSGGYWNGGKGTSWGIAVITNCCHLFFFQTLS